LIDGAQDKDRPVQRSRANGLLIAVLAIAALALSVYCLNNAPDPAMVARWWPATALITVMLIVAPHYARPLAGLGAVLVFAASLYAGHEIAFALGFAIANAVEAMLVLRWLTGFDEDRPLLRSWTDFRRWLIGLTVASSAAGAITAMTIGITGGEDLWRPLLWVTITHLGAQMVVLPLVMGHPRQKVKVSVLEVASHVGLLGVGAYACFEADQSEPVGFLLLPLLMWSAARFTPRWASVELLGVAVGIAALTATGRGPFAEVTAQASGLAISASAQTFVAVSAVTSVAFSVAMAHLRDSLRRIRENELQLGQLVDSASGTAFIATDPDGLITWFSPGAEQLLGYTAEEVVGRLTPVPFHEHRELVERADELRISTDYGVVTHALSLGEDQDTRDWTFVRKDGSRLTVSVSVTAAHDEDGATSSYLSVVRDVTDRRAAEQALMFALDKERETNQRMLELDRAKGEFVSAVSHELRTPLTSIVGYTELLTDDFSANLTALQQQLIERIERNGERLLHLVEDLLTLARVEDGSLSLNRIPTDLRDAVRSATDEVSHAAHKGRVSLRVHLPPEPVVLPGDPVHLERLVLNLVSNAVKFTPEGGCVDVDVSTGPEVAQLRVKDTGMGIPLAEQSRLFQRFFRSTLATANAIQGTGLGLHIVRSIAEAHDGSADCESTPGVGTTFRILLPTSIPASDEPEDVQDDEGQERVGQERDGSTDGEPAELL
jgi:PAS domain S-box-containing protein